MANLLWLGALLVMLYVPLSHRAIIGESLLISQDILTRFPRPARTNVLYHISSNGVGFMKFNLPVTVANSKMTSFDILFSLGFAASSGLINILRSFVLRGYFFIKDITRIVAREGNGD